MPPYQNSPFQVPRLLLKGVPVYLWGSFDYKVGNTNMQLTNSALTTNVATLTVQWLSGPLPVIGSYISVIGSTAGGGVLNVQRAIITGVTITAATGQGTLTFALTNANITSVADTGTVIIEPAEVGETIVTATNSIACVVQAPESDSQFTVPLAVTFPTMPTAVTVTLQKAVKNLNPEFTNTTSAVVVAVSAYTAGPVVEATLERGYLYRLAITGLTGSGTIVGKIG